MKVRLRYLVFWLSNYLNIKWSSKLKGGYAYFKNYNYLTPGLKILYISHIKQCLISNLTNLLSFASEKDMVQYLYEQSGYSGIQLNYGTITKIKGNGLLESDYSLKHMRGTYD